MEEKKREIDDYEEHWNDFTLRIIIFWSKF